jgi:hypothetical protein
VHFPWIQIPDERSWVNGNTIHDNGQKGGNKSPKVTEYIPKKAWREYITQYRPKASSVKTRAHDTDWQEQTNLEVVKEKKKNAWNNFRKSQVY